MAGPLRARPFLPVAARGTVDDARVDRGDGIVVRLVREGERQEALLLQVRLVDAREAPHEHGAGQERGRQEAATEGADERPQGVRRKLVCTAVDYGRRRVRTGGTAGDVWALLVTPDGAFAANAIVTGLISDGTILGADISANAIVTGLIANGTITSAEAVITVPPVENVFGSVDPQYFGRTRAGRAHTAPAPPVRASSSFQTPLVGVPWARRHRCTVCHRQPCM